MRIFHQKWIHQETNCDTFDFKPISSQKVIVAFIWISLGVAVSMVIFTMEKCLVKKCSKNNTINVETDVKDKIVNFLLELNDKSIYNKVCQKMMQRIANHEELCSEE